MNKAGHTPSGAAMTDLILEVFRLNGRLLAVGDHLTKELGLTSARWQILGALAGGPLTAAQIARNMGLKRQSVQRLVDALAAQGIVIFEDNPHHKRAKLVRMTDTGLSKFARISEIQGRWVNGVSQDLDVGALKAALALLRDIEARLQTATDTEDPVPED